MIEGQSIAYRASAGIHAGQVEGRSYTCCTLQFSDVVLAC